MDDRQGLRHAEVVIHCRGERRIDHRCLHEGSVPSDPLEEGPDAAKRCLGLVEGLSREIEARSIVGGGQGIPHDEGIVLGQHVPCEHEVSERLRHLLALDSDQSVVHPVAGEPVACRTGLGEFVLVVREAQVEATAVDVELVAQVAARHGRALDVPSGAPPPPRRIPRGIRGFVRLRALPEREVAHVALAPRIGISGRRHVVDRLTRQLAVFSPRAHVEVHVTGSVSPRLGRVGVTRADQLIDERDHLRDRSGSPRLVRRREDADRSIGGGEFLLDPVGQRPPGL